MSPPSANIVPGGRGLPIRCKIKEVQRNMVCFTFSVSVPRTFVHYCMEREKWRAIRQMQEQGLNMADIRKALNVSTIRSKIEKPHLMRMGHILRMSDDRIVKQAVLGWNQDLEDLHKARPPLGRTSVRPRGISRLCARPVEFGGCSRAYTLLLDLYAKHGKQDRSRTLRLLLLLVLLLRRTDECK